MHTVQVLEEEVGRRQRKRMATHRALSLAALELVQARGLETVTAEEIAQAADVSLRTFFNYFSCKEEAVVGVEPAVLAEIAADLRQRPKRESPAVALGAVLLAGMDDGMLQRWRLRTELVERYPALLPRYLASMVDVEEALAEALADRLGVDARSDPFPRVLVATALAVVRSTLAWWWDVSDRSAPLPELLQQTFADLVITSPRKR
jgi:AcrR family transcriptional regulator